MATGSDQFRARSASRISKRDLAWRENDVVWTIGGVIPPDPAEVRAQLLVAARAGKAGHFLKLFDIETGTMGLVEPADLPAFCDALVETFDEPYGGDLGAVAVAAQRRPLGRLPFRLAIGTDWCALHFSHALGDAGSVWPLFLFLLQPEKLSTLPPAAERREHPLFDALWHNYGRDPRRLRKVLQVPRPPIPLTSAGPGSYVEPQIAVESRVSSLEFLPAMKQWRKVNCSDASMPGIIASRAIQAARDAKLDVHSGIAVVADARRYLPSKKFGAGNFSAGAYLPIEDCSDPTEISQKITAFAHSGRPLLTLAAMTAGTRRRRPPRAGWKPDTQQRTLVSYSYVGRLPWLTPIPIDAVVLGQPIGDLGLGIVVHEMGRRMFGSVTYDRRFIDQGLAASIADALIQMPVQMPDERPDL
ncbi:hypothetical protein SAMN05892883_1080 [Jatrophihabitans sp. GAS493]|uniref:hypothetical protein n=1 Tax=Jatrophihabitans sp. GAS493 TaxID=1907575 RepID=UPI000BB6FDB1|nr:hypothetical protein [Jatrophihabitans sp. GAS493]SOD71577.1 hypothetical protein SAMN05892883_1080 [Jatrophihabitans sp. GAS493]